MRTGLVRLPVGLDRAAQHVANRLRAVQVAARVHQLVELRGELAFEGDREAFHGVSLEGSDSDRPAAV